MALTVVSGILAGLTSADLDFLYEVWRMRVAVLDSLYRALGASRTRTAPYRRVACMLRDGRLESFRPRAGLGLPRSCGQLVRVGPRGREALVAARLVASAEPRYLRPEHHAARLEAVDWYARARFHGVPANILLFREEYRERFGWGAWCPGDLALLKGSSLLVLVRAADLGDTPAGDLLRLVDSWGSRGALAVVVPDRLYGPFCAELPSFSGEPPVPVGAGFRGGLLAAPQVAWCVGYGIPNPHGGRGASGSGGAGLCAFRVPIVRRVVPVPGFALRPLLAT